jgi:hypothetical protein
MWFVLVTMTTVGYGDKVPGSAEGKFFACIAAFVGNAFIVALPIAIIGNDFQNTYNESAEKDKIEM